MRSLVKWAWIGLLSLSFLAGCASLGLTSLTPAERTLLVCEAWEGAFRRVADRRQLEIATRLELDAVNESRPVLNAVCTAEPGRAGVSLYQIEQLILQVALAEKAAKEAMQ